MLVFWPKGFHQYLVGVLIIKGRFSLAGQENSATIQIFRYGLDVLRNIALKPHGKIPGFHAGFEDFVLS